MWGLSCTCRSNNSSFLRSPPNSKATEGDRGWEESLEAVINRVASFCPLSESPARVNDGVWWALWKKRERVLPARKTRWSRRLSWH